MQLSLTGGDVASGTLHWPPGTVGEAIVMTGYIHINISVWELFKGRLDVWRAEVDGADMVIDRGADGRIASLQKLIDSLRSSQASSQTAAASTVRGKRPSTLLHHCGSRRCG